MENKYEDLINLYSKKKFEYEYFLKSVEFFFKNNPALNSKSFPVIHSVKSRMKEPSHLMDKLLRKENEGIVITQDNFFKIITDFAGVRVLHIYQDQFELIHSQITKNVRQGEWAFVEPPKAYSWDPDSKALYDRLNIISEINPSYYTSVHYIIKPNNLNPNPVSCEIQVRTLFEEAWGEISHYINYPHPTKSKPCKEQLKVLAKLVSTGTRLADSIFHTYDEFEKDKIIEKKEL